jgi:hypothetical protein
MTSRSRTNSPSRSPSRSKIDWDNTSVPSSTRRASARSPVPRNSSDTQSGTRSGKKYMNKKLKIPDDIENELYSAFSDYKWFKGLLKQAAELSAKGGFIHQASKEKESRQFKVDKGTNILIEIPYNYKDDAYKSFTPVIYYYAYDSDHNPIQNSTVGKQILLTKDGDLVARTRRIKFSKNSDALAVGDQLGKRPKAHDFLDGGLMIKPVNRTKGYVIIKLPPDETLEIVSAAKNLKLHDSNTDFQTFYEQNHEAIWEEFSKVLRSVMKIDSITGYTGKLMNRYMYLIPGIVNSISGDDRYLVQEFVSLVTSFFDDYAKDYRTLIKSIKKRGTEKPRKDLRKPANSNRDKKSSSSDNELKSDEEQKPKAKAPKTKSKFTRIKKNNDSSDGDSS